jgi:ribosomal protein L7Ae-like RNA K-turn-binding protein
MGGFVGRKLNGNKLIMGNRKRDAKPAPTVGKPNRKPLAPQVKNGANKKPTKRPAANVISRPYLLPQYNELTKEDRDIVLDRLRKEIVVASVALPTIKPFIIRGVNQVARLIAKRELRVVVFASNPDTSVATFGHIPMLCRLHKVPVCVLHISSKALGSVFQLPNLCVLGIKRLPKRNATTDGEASSSATGEGTANQKEISLGELEYEKLQSISDFLVAKASAKNHSLQ